MTAQRIVLTSPWKLGLFVFLLVAGTGFGLLYAYIELFGAQIEVVATNLQVLDQEIEITGNMTVRDAYLVVGAIAALSLVGYLAVVTSARPLDRVVRGSRKRDQALKRLGGVKDPRDLDLEDFEDEPTITHLLERWTIDAQRANDAQLDAAAQREALAGLAAQVREAAAEGRSLEPVSHDPAVNALIESVNQLVRDAASAAENQVAAEAPRPVAASATAVDAAWNAQRSAVGHAIEDLSAAEGELTGFVDSVAARAVELARVAQRLSQTDASGAIAPVGAVIEGAQATGKRLTQLRLTLEELAEQANKLAITMALQLDRLGEAGNEMIDTVEQARTISTRYQRVVADLRLCENDHVTTLQALQHAGGNAPAADGQVLASLRQESMVLDQNAEALREVLGQLRSPLTKLRAAVGQSEPEIVEAAGVDAEERIYEIAELGGHRIDEDQEPDVYDLQQFGAVQL